MQLFPNTTISRSITIACPKGGGVSIFGSGVQQPRGNANERLGGVIKVDSEFKNAGLPMSDKCSRKAENIISQCIAHTQMHTGVGNCASKTRKANWFSIDCAKYDKHSAFLGACLCKRGIAPLFSHLSTIIP